ncbi:MULTISPECIES: NAD(+)/NADH kinase [Clostridium]|jgi:NAD+ kinase|uniref:NAD kinase n=2 Tax=Clostridium butyricum TaxID=1492 RepID=C4IL85_CLOBU|nr:MULTISPECIES: NAD(+)/NADH kinase [Clostridium]ETI87776.1 MAG: putative inorganic polyphosphate/ATP-NAD kinase [Clostridium butyricum DORA_1]ALP90825.1 NAD(+) kinase [Clostridium butyricum]ALS17353.1 NAD(+) kinase [Clostridium butyricum]ANF14448.1 NAD(+) kinase [Clostridium butyricum]AOR94513.1 NAD(+) kinase [Clostridium butyricum]
MKNIGIAINPSKDNDNKILNMVINKIKDVFKIKEVHIFNSYDLERQNLKSIELLVVLGGDGTLLSAARSVKEEFNGILFGINIGNLGFLSSIEISDIDTALTKLKNNEYEIQERMMLECAGEFKNIVECGLICKKELKNIKGCADIDDFKKEKLNAFNDVVLARGTLSRMVKFKIYVDGKLYSSFKGDGLIVATPTGSTAYSFSAGGPFIYPDLELITITPICPHTKSMQTIVLKGDSIIEIYAENEEEKIYLTVDGQKAMEVNQKSCVKIYKKQKNVKLLLFDDYDYFKVLRNKILNNSKECDGEEF